MIFPVGAIYNLYLGVVPSIEIWSFFGQKAIFGGCPKRLSMKSFDIAIIRLASSSGDIPFGGQLRLVFGCCSKYRNLVIFGQKAIFGGYPKRLFSNLTGCN